MFQANLFQKQKVLITGGGSGIGYSIAEQFLKYGAEVWIAARNEERLQKAAHELNQLGECHYSLVDIREEATIEALMEEIFQKWGRLDVLVNNAGGQFRAPAEKISNKGWTAVIHNNLDGTWYMTKAVSDRFFIPQQRGNIINIVAQMFRGFPGMVHTGAARAGVDNMTKTLAVEWSKFQIRVNAIAPGAIMTSGFDTYPAEFQEYILKEVPKHIPMNQLGKAEDIAYCTLFLASPMAHYITGETIYIDGGQKLWGDSWELPEGRWKSL